MNVALPEQCVPSVGVVAGAEESGPQGWPFVATSLDFWLTSEPDRFARDCQIDDTAYRRLDPEYYAWLRSRMALAKKATAAGRLDPAAFEILRVRFNAVHEWAVGHFGEPQLAEAVRTLRAKEYKPPIAAAECPTALMKAGQRSGGEKVSQDVIAAVDAISERALSLGWKPERLYGVGSGGLCDPQRGLVCFLKPGDRIGEVTAQSIEIILAPPSDVRQRFYNPDVEQPWARRVGTGH
jgi:hypothetical protein